MVKLDVHDVSILFTVEIALEKNKWKVITSEKSSFNPFYSGGSSGRLANDVRVHGMARFNPFYRGCSSGKLYKVVHALSLLLRSVFML